MGSVNSELAVPEVLAPGEQLQCAKTSAAAREAADVLAALQAFVVDSDAKAESVIAAGKEAKRRWQAWEDIRKPIAVRIDNSKRTLQEQFRPILDGYANITALARAKITAWLESKKQAQRALEAKAVAAHAAGEAPIAVAALVTASAAPVKVQGARTRETWHGIVMDRAALVRAVADGKAPAELVTPCQAELDKLARETHGRVPVPGVRFEAQTQTSFVEVRRGDTNNSGNSGNSG